MRDENKFRGIAHIHTLKPHLHVPACDSLNWIIESGLKAFRTAAAKPV